MKTMVLGCICGVCAILAFPRPALGWETRSGRHCTVCWADPAQAQEVDAVLDLLEEAHEELTAALAHAPKGPCRVTASPSTAAFIEATGKPGWVAAVSGEDGILLQPLKLLRERGLLAQAIRHEYVHLVVRDLSGERAPVWLHEGLALLVSGEGPRLPQVPPSVRPISLDELEAALRRPHTKTGSEALYREAFTRVRDLLVQGGWFRIRELLRSFADGRNAEEALVLVYGHEVAGVIGGHATGLAK